MKQLTMMAVAICLSMPLLANTGKESKVSAKKSISISKTGDQLFNFQFMSESSGKVEIKIFSEEGKLIHRDLYAYKKSFKVPFDLSNLKEGNYKFVVQGQDVQESQEVFVSKLQEQDVAAFVQPIGDNKVKLTIYHDNTPVSVALYGENGSQYFSEKLVADHNFTQLFDLSEVSNENIELVVKGRKTTIRKSL